MVQCIAYMCGDVGHRKTQQHCDVLCVHLKWHRQTSRVVIAEFNPPTYTKRVYLNCLIYPMFTVSLNGTKQPCQVTGLQPVRCT